MRIGRILLIVGLILLLGALAIGGFVFLRSRFSSPAPAEGVAEGTPVAQEPENLAQIAVAAQNLPRGLRITADTNAVILEDWPLDSVPVGALTSLESAYDRIARTDIQLGMPILESMLTDTAGELASAGSEIALQIPADMVAYAVPLSRYSSAAWAIRPGDHVDIMMSLLMVDLDEDFQSLLPNKAECVSPTEDEACQRQAGVIGRFEVMPNGWLVNTIPTEGQRSRLVTQLAVQDALVLHVGEFERAGEEAAAQEAGPTPTPEPGQGAGQTEVAPALPEVEPVLLAVSRQDAMALEYAQAVGARLNAVLRSAGDAQSASTESVTLQYLMDRFSIELPPKLPYGVTPPISSLERVARSEDAANYGDGGGSPQSEPAPQ